LAITSGGLAQRVPHHLNPKGYENTVSFTNGRR
jgi:hypothetical protein